jgi:hypothetical protein
VSSSPAGVTLTLISSGPSTPDNCLVDGTNTRKMATMVVDFVAMPVQTTADGSFTFPELTYIPGVSQETWVGYQLLEFDLASFINGIGLDEVRSVMVFSRTSYSATGMAPGTAPSDAVGSQAFVISPILTQIKSLQSVPIGAITTLGVEDPPATNFQSFPFFGSGNSIPCRLLVPVDTTDAASNPIGQGKYQFVFCNWDVSSTSQLGIAGHGE